MQIKKKTRLVQTEQETTEVTKYAVSGLKVNEMSLNQVTGHQNSFATILADEGCG